jgi:serine/threonine protein kinase
VRPPAGLEERAIVTATVPTIVPPNEGPTEIGDRIGKYEVIREVGRGSTGTVYLAHDPYYGRDVAIKAYRIAADGDPARAKVARKMFMSEAHMVGMLQHPNIMPIYDAGEENGHYYIVTEFIHGARTLAAYTRPDNLLPVEDVLTLMFKCAKSLHYAHSRGVIHRDIKPSNLMLTTDSDLRLIDFGIALHTDADFSRIEGIAGSPSYMSPEQVQSAELTNHSDLYSLGAVMYELLTGHRPFRAGALAKLLHQIVYATPPPMLSLRPELPAELEAVVAMALDKDPGKRYPNGAEFAAAIAKIHAQQRTQADRSEQQEQFNQLRRLKFFHEFSAGEIWEVLRAGTFQAHQRGDEIVKAGGVDDRFYVLVAGRCTVERDGVIVGRLEPGDCFGETSYLRGAKRQAGVVAGDGVMILKVSSTLLEQASPACQLRFNKVFLRALISRLQHGERSISS